MISDARIHEIHELIQEHGVPEVAEMLNISIDSVQRYDRLYKSDWMPRVPKVFVYDIETIPHEVYSWRLGYNVSLSAKNIIRDGGMLSWAGKWLFGSKMFSDIMTPDEVVSRDYDRIAKSLYKMINEADIVIAHNGRRFDIKKMNTSFFHAGLPRPTPYQVIDTLDIVRKNFSFANNTLDNLVREVGGHRKLDTEYQLWLDCMKGDQEALDRMIEYNRGDILALEDLYMAVRGWTNSHPNMAIYAETDQHICTICTSKNVRDIDQPYVTPMNKYQAIRCDDCGAILREAKSLMNKEEKAVLYRSVAR